MSEKSPKHVTDLSEIFDDLKEGTIMYGHDPEENTDKQLPLDLFISRFEDIETRLTLIEAGTLGTDIVISNFTITPDKGIYGSSHNHIITAAFDRSITHDDLILFNLIYGDNTIDLVDSADAVFNSTTNSVIITYSNLQNSTLNATTSFSLSMRLTDGSIGTSSTILYTNIPQITISSFVITKERVNTQDHIIATITLGNYNIADSISAELVSSPFSTQNGNFINSEVCVIDWYEDILTESVEFTLNLVQTVLSDTYSLTTTGTLEVIPDMYTVSINIYDDLDEPDAVEGVLGITGVYGATSDSEGLLELSLPNGVYSITLSKDYYTTQVIEIEVANDVYETLVTLVPEVEFLETPTATNPVLGETMTVTYNLLPDNKYEDDCTIVYTVLDLNEEVINGYPVTKTKVLNPDDYKELDIDAGWSNLYQIQIDITTEYKTQTNNEMITKTVGTPVVRWGVIETLTTPEERDIAYVVANILTEVAIAAAKECQINNITTPSLNFQTKFTTEAIEGHAIYNGYPWIAFPSDDYDTFNKYRDSGDPDWFNMSTWAYTTSVSIGGTNYDLYVNIGAGQVTYPYFGELPGLANVQFTYQS